MSGGSGLNVQSSEIKYSATTLGINHPTALPDLHKIILHAMKRPVKADRDDFVFWMDKATKWKRAADLAKEGTNREWLYVCCARAAMIIMDKVLRHPNLDSELTFDQKRIMQLVSRIDALIFGIS